MKMLGMLPIEQIEPNKWNANELPEKAEALLKQQMKISGRERTEPVIVRRRADGKWELINGEQRWRIAKQLGWKELPAVEIDEEDEEAMRLCLTYNSLRGTANLVKLARMAASDERLYRIYALIYGEEEAKKLAESAKKLAPEAEKELSSAVREDAKLTTEVVGFVANVPEEYQAPIARVAKKDVTMRYMRAFAEKTGAVPPSEGPVDREKLEEFLREKEGERKAEAGAERRLVTKRLKTAVIEEDVDIEKPGKYRVFYDVEKKKVGIKSVETVQTAYGPVELERFQEGVPKVLLLTVKCKCGNSLQVEVSTETGEFKVR